MEASHRQPMRLEGLALAGCGTTAAAAKVSSWNHARSGVPKLLRSFALIATGFRERRIAMENDLDAIAAELLAICTDQGLSLIARESCTAGFIAQILADAPNVGT
jgi:hypothetical protein